MEGTILSARITRSLLELDKLPDEALQQVLDDLESVSRSAADGEPPSSPAKADNIRWQALSSALRVGGPDASAEVRAEVERWILTQELDDARGDRSKAMPVRFGRAGRIWMASLALWSVYVAFRTFGNHQIAGIDLFAWDKDELLSNWLGLPSIATALYLVGQWALGRSAGLQIAGWTIALKRPSELPLMERIMLVVAPILLVPVGAYLLFKGISDQDIEATLVGVFLASLPIWQAAKIQRARSARKGRPD